MQSTQTTPSTARVTTRIRSSRFFKSRSFRRFASLAAGLLLISACGQSNDDASGSASAAATASTAAATTVALANVDEARIINADAEPGNWMAHGRTYDEQRHSPLTQISDKTVKDLGLAWYWDTETTRGLEASPIVVDGIMYSTGSWSVVWAHNAKTGELLWKFDPEVPRSHGVYACCDVVNRGVAVWKGRVYVGTIDGRLIALNAEDGTQAWSEQTTDRDRAYTITGAPRVVKGNVIIGNGGAEYGVRGYVTAYDADTGKQQWRFYTVPGNPDEPYETKALEEAAKTWRGNNYWKVGGGGTVWDSMAYDPELNTLYIGVGNGSPWNRYIRSPGGGDNLYLSSIVALNPDTGEYKWHYQTTPGDNWDYTATQHMILADMEIGGVERKVIMQAPKNGFFYVIDRVSGQFISAEAYVPLQWATHIDPETGRPVESPDAQYANDLKTIQPGPLGGHNWHPMTYSPKTNLVYIPALGLEFKFAQNNAFKYDPKTWNLGVDFNLPGPATPDEIVETLQKVKGHLAAWDPVKQEEVWRVQHDASWNGGLLSTSGNLLFQGLADGSFTAYTADTGKKVWSSPVHVGIIAPPISYMVDGEQYIAVVAGWGGAFGLSAGVPRHKSNMLTEGRILAYKLGGKEVLPEPKIAWMELPKQPTLVASADELANGQALFNNNCQVCHGAGVISSTGSVPDLRYMSDATHASWDAIVRGGAYTGKGMVSFAHVVDEQGSKDLHAYVVSVANASIGLCETEYRKNYPELLETACVKATPMAEVPQQAPKGGASR